MDSSTWRIHPGRRSDFFWTPKIRPNSDHHGRPEKQSKTLILLVFKQYNNLYIYLDSPTTLKFWGLSRKMAFFSESTFFEIKYCFLHVSDVHSWRYSWNCGNQINVPHCRLATHCCRCHFVLAAWRCRSKDFQSIGSRLHVWCHGSFIIARMRVGLNTQLRTCGCIAPFWWQLVLGRFAHTTQTCKGLCFFKRTFFPRAPAKGSS